MIGVLIAHEVGFAKQVRAANADKLRILTVHFNRFEFNNRDN